MYYKIKPSTSGVPTHMKIKGLCQVSLKELTCYLCADFHVHVTFAQRTFILKLQLTLLLCVQVAKTFFIFYLFVHVAGKYFLSMNHDSSTFLFVKECIWNKIIESIDKDDY